MVLTDFPMACGLENAVKLCGWNADAERPSTRLCCNTRNSMHEAHQQELLLLQQRLADQERRLHSQMCNSINVFPAVCSALFELNKIVFFVFYASCCHVGIERISMTV